MNIESCGIITGLTDEYAGCRLYLYADETVWFGSDPRNDTVLTGERVSPLHCGISYDQENNCFWVACESEFGVLAEGEGWIRKGTEVRLPSGAQIRIGDYRFALSCAETERESGNRRSDTGNGFYREVPEEGDKALEAECEYGYHRMKNRSDDDEREDARCGDARCDGDDSSEFSRRKSRIKPKYIGIGGIVAVVLLVVSAAAVAMISGSRLNNENTESVSVNAELSVSSEEKNEDSLNDGPDAVDENIVVVDAAEMDSVDSLALIAEGTVEEAGLTWKLDSDGVLTIGGDTDMELYTNNIDMPWAHLSDQILSIVIEEGVTRIDHGAFRFASNLESVVIPDTVTEIGMYAFGDCVSLTSISIPDSVTYLGKNAFERCYALSSVRISSNITVIPYGAFSSCRGLKEVIIPNGVETISQYAFSCENMTEVYIAASVTEIEGWAFAYCPLENIYYEGTEVEWNSIQIVGLDMGLFNSEIADAVVHYEYDLPKME